MKRIVVISGGTGGFTILSGLKKYDINISAIVTMADSGGSSGRLRDEYGVLPPGDIRQCLVALSTEDKVMRNLFNYRFSNGSLTGQSFGNLLLTALTKTTGSFKQAVEEASKVLAIKGKVIPVTTDSCQLVAELEDGTIIKGEHNIDEPKHNLNLKIKKVWLEPEATANEDAIKAVKEADTIVFGPGDLFTSIIPNILVKGISKAIKESKAKKVFVCNLMTKHGQTDGFTIKDHIETLRSYLDNGIDYVIFNTQQPPKEVLERYAKEKEYPVKFEDSNDYVVVGSPKLRLSNFSSPTKCKGEEKISPVRTEPAKKGKVSNGKIKIIKAELLSEKLFEKSSGDKLRRSLIRHDPEKLARVVMEL